MQSSVARHSIPNDTASAAESAWLACIRGLTPVQRLEKACALSQRGRRSAIEVIRRRHPTASPSEVRLRFIEFAFGPALAADVGRWLQDHAG